MATATVAVDRAQASWYDFRPRRNFFAGSIVMAGMDNHIVVQRLSNNALKRDLGVWAQKERESLSAFLIHLGEFDARKNAKELGYPSTYEYLLRALGYSEGGAMRRLTAARTIRKFKLVSGMLDRGEVHLAAIARLAPFLTKENYREVLARARGMRMEEVARIVAEFNPQKPPRDTIRIVSAPKPTERNVSISASPSGNPAFSLESGPAVSDAGGSKEAAELYYVTFTASKKTAERLKRAKELLRHRFPSGDLDRVVGEALGVLLERIDRGVRGRRRRRTQRRAPKGRKSQRPSRRVPEAVKVKVWRRDRARCVFRGPDGVRCGSKSWLEFDHRRPFALGGKSDDAGNIRLLCRTHNQMTARQVFGDRVPSPRK